MMQTSRKIIVELATSADGFIARRDGSVDWLDRPHPKGDYGMGEFVKSVDTIIMGRKTYQKGIEMGMTSSPSGPRIKNFVFSRKPQKDLLKGFESANEPVKAFAQKLRQQPGKNIWMMGGGELIASFLDEGELDEFRIHLIPVFIGEGIPLIAPGKRTVQLHLISSKSFEDGVVELNYRVRV